MVGLFQGKSENKTDDFVVPPFMETLIWLDGGDGDWNQKHILEFSMIVNIMICTTSIYSG